MKANTALFVLMLTVLAECRPQEDDKTLLAQSGEDLQGRFSSSRKLNLVRRQVSQSSSTEDPNTTTSTRIPPANPEIPVVYKVTCPCPFTPQYSPVCGSDGQNYGNSQILNCARFCGVNVTMVYGTTCGSNRG